MKSGEKPENSPSSSEPSGGQVKTADLYAVNEQNYQKPGFKRGKDGYRGRAAVPGSVAEVSGFLSTAVMEALATSSNTIDTT